MVFETTFEPHKQLQLWNLKMSKIIAPSQTNIFSFASFDGQDYQFFQGTYLDKDDRYVGGQEPSDQCCPGTMDHYPGPEIINLPWYINNPPFSALKQSQINTFIPERPFMQLMRSLSGRWIWVNTSKRCKDILIKRSFFFFCKGCRFGTT